MLHEMNNQSSRNCMEIVVLDTHGVFVKSSEISKFPRALVSSELIIIVTINTECHMVGSYDSMVWRLGAKQTREYRFPFKRHSEKFLSSRWLVRIHESPRVVLPRKADPTSSEKNEMESNGMPQVSVGKRLRVD